jgi:hypothetical protein
MPTDGIAVAALDLSLFPNRFSIFLERMITTENVEEPLVFTAFYWVNLVLH